MIKIGMWTVPGSCEWFKLLKACETQGTHGISLIQSQKERMDILNLARTIWVWLQDLLLLDLSTGSF